jgi:hypothetical protein
LGAQDGIEDRIIFYVISRHFLMDFSTPMRFSKAQPTIGPNPMSLTMISVPSPDGQIFHRNGAFSIDKNEG